MESASLNKINKVNTNTKVLKTTPIPIGRYEYNGEIVMTRTLLSAHLGRSNSYFYNANNNDKLRKELIVDQDYYNIPKKEAIKIIGRGVFSNTSVLFFSSSGVAKLPSIIESVDSDMIDRLLKEVFGEEEDINPAGFKELNRISLFEEEDEKQEEIKEKYKSAAELNIKHNNKLVKLNKNSKKKMAENGNISAVSVNNNNNNNNGSYVESIINKHVNNMANELLSEIFSTLSSNLDVSLSFNSKTKVTA